MERKVEPRNIRQEALSALEKSTKLFVIAENLLRQGNKSEAEWVTNEARAQRNISVWLMAKANKANPTDNTSGRHQDTYRHLDHTQLRHREIQ